MIVRQVSIINLAEKSEVLGDSARLATKLVCKFITVACDKELTCVFGPLSAFPYHADLLRYFCDMHSIPSGWVRKPDIYEIHDDAYAIKGGGWLEMNIVESTIRFYGRSTLYGKFDEQEIVALFSGTSPYSNFSLIIER